MNARMLSGSDTRRMMAACATVACVMAFGASSALAKPGNGNGNNGNGLGENGQSIGNSDAIRTVAGVVRDFRKYQQPGGHPDFGKLPDIGAAHTMGNVADTLSPDGRIVFAGLGKECIAEWRDAQGRAIHPSLYDPAKGDTAGAYGVADDGAIDSATSFSSWYADVPGLNQSGSLLLDFEYDTATGIWAHDDRLTTNKSIKGGGSNANFEYTFELDLQFIYQMNQGHYLEIGGMDDCWVFIDGRLVVDLGGVNHAENQFVPLDRLGLTDGQIYDIKIFMSERVKQREDVRIAMNFDFWDGELPTTMALYD